MSLLSEGTKGTERYEIPLFSTNVITVTTHLLRGLPPAVAAVVTIVPGEPGDRGLPERLRSLPSGLADLLRPEPLWTLPIGLPPAVAAVVYSVLGEPGDPSMVAPAVYSVFGDPGDLAGLPPAVAAVVYSVCGEPGEPERLEPLPSGLADLLLPPT